MSILLPRRLSRRALLGGAGALVSLPLLESLLPRAARAQDTAPVRFLAFYVPNGIHMAEWTPSTTGAGYQLTPILAPLANVKSKLSVLSGLDSAPGESDGPGDHASGTGSFLTAAHVYKTEGADIQNGISVDQVAANAIGELTTIPSMQLGIQGGADAGGCDSGYSCAYTRNISWASATQPLNKITNPQVVFDQLFAGYDPEATAEELAKKRAYRLGVLDYVRQDAKSLQLKLSYADKLKLDEYLTGVDELEKKIIKAASGPQCIPPEEPGSGLDYPDHVRAMLDLMVVAFACDSTRIISFMLGNAGSNQSYSFIGVPGAHHEISHHQDQQSNFDMLRQIDIWEVEQLAYLLEKLDAIEEGEGSTMLDHSIVYFSSEIEDGNSHSHYNLPVVLAGGGGGAFSPGRHVTYDEAPMGNLFISILEAMGVETSTFGDDGTAPLSDL
jgi:hypothetical protein